MYAQITINGKVTKDPETKFLNGEMSKTIITVRVYHRGKKPDGQQYPDSDIYSAEVWGPSGEAAANHLRKGELVFVTGRLEVTKGDKGSWLNVRNANWDFTGSKRPDDEQPF